MPSLPSALLRSRTSKCARCGARRRLGLDRRRRSGCVASLSRPTPSLSPKPVSPAAFRSGGRTEPASRLAGRTGGIRGRSLDSPLPEKTGPIPQRAELHPSAGRLRPPARTSRRGRAKARRGAREPASSTRAAARDWTESRAWRWVRPAPGRPMPGRPIDDPEVGRGRLPRRHPARGSSRGRRTVDTPRGQPRDRRTAPAPPTDRSSIGVRLRRRARGQERPRPRVARRPRNGRRHR